eukprot:scaffold5613_cov210-Skeletonema_marinoi.AAC.6
MSKVQDEVREDIRFQKKRGRRAHNWGLRLIGGDSGCNQDVKDRRDSGDSVGIADDRRFWM